MLARGLKHTGLLLALIALAPAAARAAPTTPELFVSEGDTSSTGAKPPQWVPLDGARMTGAAVYRLGVRLQANGDPQQRAYVVINEATSPQTPQSGSATVPGPGSCVTVRGSAGDIVEWGTARYYGDGAYRLSAALADHAPGGCPAGGAVASGTFTVDARPAVAIVDVRANDARPPGPFRGVTLVPTADGVLPELLCARDPVVQPDGSLTGSVVRRSDEIAQPDGGYSMSQAAVFTDSGQWSCVGRAKGGPDLLHTGWSSPVSATVLGDFSVRFDRMLDESYPTYAARFRVDRGAAGETITFALKSCRRYSRSGGRPLSTKRLRLSATVGPRGTAIVRFRRRVKPAQFGRYFVGRARFAGNELIAAGRSPQRFAFSEVLDSLDGPQLGVHDADPC